LTIAASDEQPPFLVRAEFPLQRCVAGAAQRVARCPQAPGIGSEIAFEQRIANGE
jgi:hypothetical protein